MIYFLTFGITIFLFGIGEYTHKRIFIFLAILILIAFAGLRFQVGRDFNSYRIIYLTILNGTTELGFRLLNLGVFLLNLNFQLVFLVSSFITILLVTTTIRNVSPYITFSFFIFITGGFLLESFNIVRQWIAIPIFFYSCKFIIEKRFLKYIIAICIASLFHKSALILIPAYFIGNLTFNKYLLIIILLFSLLMTFFIDIGAVMSKIPFYSFYFSSNTKITSADLGFGYLSKLLIGGFILIYYRNIINQNSYARLSVNFFFLYLIILALFRDSQILVRIGYYFHIFLILVIPFIMNVMNKKSRYIFGFVFILFSTLILSLSIYNTSEKYLPYSFNLNFVNKNLK